MSIEMDIDANGSHNEMNNAPVFDPPEIMKGAYINSHSTYMEMYNRSIYDPSGFWSDMAKSELHWFRPFTETIGGSLENGDVRFFADGQLNVSYNCLDRHIIAGRGDDIALVWEPDEPNSPLCRTYTYKEVLAEVCRIANVMKSYGVRRGDTIAIYMPMMPEIAFVMLAATRIGAIHSVVFAGFSSDSLRDRIIDARCRWVFTADEGRRGGRTVPLKATTDIAVAQCACVEKVFVFRRTGVDVSVGVKDVMIQDLLPTVRPFCPAESMDAESMLFLLYTSGSTGKPKGIVHTTAGYLLYAAITHKYVFNVHRGDVYACMADCGWITGHSYLVYGPLCNGVTSVMFESTPLYPDPSRYWDCVEKHGITHFYTAPTAIRALMRFGDAPVKKHNLNSLKVLGSVGEPINPEAWKWFYEVVGQSRCAIADTYWQTETGGHIITPLPGATRVKPGSACFPFFGIDVVLKDRNGQDLHGNDVSGVVCIRNAWPGIARTIYGDHDRYLATYMRPYAGVYFTGDGAVRDKDGYIWITGRVDDVLNVSGHRLGSAEIESALVAHSRVSEAAVIGFPHETKGEGICCYVTLKEGVKESPQIISDLRNQVRKVIGPFATPDYIVLTHALPKTRSGKIMRRVLRKIIAGQTSELGDITTLADSNVVQELIVAVEKVLIK